MLLCIDIGNTNIVFGVYENNKKLCDFRLETKIKQTYDEYGLKVLDIFKHLHIDASSISGVIISSVVPQLDQTIEIFCEKYIKYKPIFVGPGIKTGLKIKSDNPKELGADLLVGCVSAHIKYGCPVLVIDMGTATTLFVVNSQKEIIGGIILPGLKISFSTLFEKTSKLEDVRLSIPKNIIGKDTVSCLQSGMIYGSSSMIDGLINKIKAEIGECKVVLTGGIGGVIRPHLENEVIYDSDLLLDGLNYLYYKNVNN